MSVTTPDHPVAVPPGGIQTEFVRADGKKILRIDNGWSCCPHDYIILDKDPYAKEEKDGSAGNSGN